MFEMLGHNNSPATRPFIGSGSQSETCGWCGGRLTVFHGKHRQPTRYTDYCPHCRQSLQPRVDAVKK